MPANPYPSASLSREQASAYLTRIELPQDLLDSPPTLPLLSQILLAHHEQVPKDTSPLHLPASLWNADPEAPLTLGTSFTGMPLGVDAYHRVVDQHKGAFCFALNPTFATLLRYWGFRVSELVANCYQRLGNNPKTHPDGYIWGAKTHEVLVVDWEEKGEPSKRYFVDVGFGGGGCALPLEVKDGETIHGLNPYEAYKAVNEFIPLDDDVPTQPDRIKGWTFYRRIAPPGQEIVLPITDNSPGFWSPQFHLLLQTVSLRDFGLYHHYSASHELAAFTAFFLVTKLIPGTGGARRSVMFSEGKDGKPKEGDHDNPVRRAKVHTTGGIDAKGSPEPRDVVYVEMVVGKMKEHLEKEWGFKF